MNTEDFSTLEWIAFFDLINTSFGFSIKATDDLIKYIESYRGKINWFSLKDWESLDDISIYRALEGLARLSGDIFVITDLSYIKEAGPFILTDVNFQVFIRKYSQKFNECFFNGDVLIFSLEHKLIWIFQHEGIYTLVKLT